MTEPTTAEIRERHEAAHKTFNYSQSTPAWKSAHKDRGILLDRMEAAEATIKEISEFGDEIRLSANEITCSSVSKILLRGVANDLEAILNRSKS